MVRVSNLSGNQYIYTYIHVKYHKLYSSVNYVYSFLKKER